MRKYTTQILMIFDVTGKLEFYCRPHMRTEAVNGLRQ